MNASTSDIVSIVVGRQTLSGWQEVRITRSLEAFPSSFDLGLTEKYPTQAQDIVISPGDPCKVMIGDDVIVTGYVDAYTAKATAEEHSVHITGRGMCQDLVDCSAMFTTFQTNNTTIVSLAKMLTQKFGITVKAPDGDSPIISQFNVILTETPYEIIERVARWANFLVYEDTDGSLVVGRVGDTSMGSGFVEGSNIENEQVSFTVGERFTEMHATFLSTAFLLDPPPAAGSSSPVIPAGQFVADATDTSFPPRADGKPRYRPLIIVSEQTANSIDLAKQRTQWDMARRIGRSQQFQATVDSWRDGGGTLWSVNALAPINAPAMKLQNQTWVIANISFVRNDSGTHAEVALMPKAAFVPAPENLLPFQWQVAQDQPGGAVNTGPVAR